MMHKILNFCDSKRKSRFNYEVKHFLVLYFFNTLIQVYFVRFKKKFVHMNTIFDLFLLLKINDQKLNFYKVYILLPSLN